jgi:NodT family efflux transporter outer membrane factor (OMF) lipoprotein
MIRYFIVFLVIVLFTIVFNGCSPFAPQSSVDTPVALPTDYRVEPKGTPVPDKWWQAFGSHELNSLVERALVNNLDIRTAWTRLKQARAIARKSRSFSFPSLDLQASGSRDQRYYHGELATSLDDISFGLEASYELDLWGRIDSREQADLQAAAASKEDVRAAGISVAAEVVTTWIDLLNVREKIDVLKDQITTNADLLKVQERRFTFGLIPVTDVLQQQETLAGSKADLSRLQTEQRLYQHTLAVLLGHSPGAENLRIQGEGLPEPIPLPGTGLPCDLLEARPDVKAARLRFLSAGWDVSVAKADRLPQVTLSASGQYTGPSLDAALSNWLVRLTTGLTQPIFDAGRLKAEVDRSEAVAEESLLGYGLTIIEAVKEVQDALVQEAGQSDYIARIRAQLDAAQSAMNQTQIRYLNGQENYLTFLTQLKTVQSLKLRLVEERAKRLKYRVSLHRALGTDWAEDMESS